MDVRISDLVEDADEQIVFVAVADDVCVIADVPVLLRVIAIDFVTTIVAVLHIVILGVPETNGDQELFALELDVFDGREERVPRGVWVDVPV